MPSDSLRKVHSGFDPVSGKRHYLDEVLPAGSSGGRGGEGPDAVAFHGSTSGAIPKTRATVNQLLDRYLETLDVEPTTGTRCAGLIRIHLRPALGSPPLSKLDGDMLDWFFGQLRRCRDRENGPARHLKHGAQRDHGLATTSARPCVRRTRSLNAAFHGVGRWRLIGRNGKDFHPAASREGI